MIHPAYEGLKFEDWPYEYESDLPQWPPGFFFDRDLPGGQLLDGTIIASIRDQERRYESSYYHDPFFLVEEADMYFIKDASRSRIGRTWVPTTKEEVYG